MPFPALIVRFRTGGPIVTEPAFGRIGLGNGSLRLVVARAALTRALNAGDRAAAGAGFMNWLRPASLRPRREAERDLFLHGRYPAGPIPVWAADATGRVDFSRPVRRLSEAEALALLRPASIQRPTPRPPAQPRGLLAWLRARLSGTHADADGSRRAGP